MLFEERESTSMIHLKLMRPLLLLILGMIYVGLMLGVTYKNKCCLSWQLYLALHMTITSLEEVVQLTVKHPVSYFFSHIPEWYDSFECNAVINSKQPTPVIYPTFSLHFLVKCVILTTPDF